MKKFMSLVLALVMVMAMMVPAMAQTVGTDAEGKGSITIANAAKGETYAIYKLFDATVTGTEDGSIAYTGTIPDSLAEYFTKDSAGNITATEAATNGGDAMSDGLKAALTEWAKTATKTAEVVSDGSELTFAGIDYGYYVVTTTQGNGVITVDSTNPDVTVYDKNSTQPTLTKSVDDDDVYIGQTVTYTADLKTTNFDGEGEDAKQIVKYVITDTLPEFLSNVTVTSIIVDNDGDVTTTDDQTVLTVQQFVEKKITIDWVDAEGNSLYKNGAHLIITYTATVTDEAQIAGAGNTNKVTAQWITEGNTEPEDDKLEDEETIYTYAIALKKVDEKGNSLAGAVFEFPFYVKATPDTDGAYIYGGTEAGDGLVNQITTPASGEIVIKGVASGDYSITEVTAPNGYNKLTAPVTITAVKTEETTTKKTFYIDSNGVVTETESTVTVTYTNDKLATAVIVIVNMTGAELPSTGGMGTTMMYIGGGLLVAFAVIMLATKRRMNAAE